MRRLCPIMVAYRGRLGASTLPSLENRRKRNSNTLQVLRPPTPHSPHTTVSHAPTSTLVHIGIEADAERMGYPSAMYLDSEGRLLPRGEDAGQVDPPNCHSWNNLGHVHQVMATELGWDPHSWDHDETFDLLRQPWHGEKGLSTMQKLKLHVLGYNALNWKGDEEDKGEARKVKEVVAKRVQDELKPTEGGPSKGGPSTALITLPRAPTRSNAADTHPVFTPHPSSPLTPHPSPLTLTPLNLTPTSHPHAHFSHLR